MLFQVSDRRVGYILNKSENVTPELFAIYMPMMQANKANESVSEFSNMFLKGYPLEAKTAPKN